MESDRDPTDEDWTYVPTSAVPDEFTYTHVGDFAVEGETFSISRRNEDGSNHYDWISGPNAGYGFSVSGSAEPLSQERHAAAIRGFLAAIDPATGYL